MKPDSENKSAIPPRKYLPQLSTLSNEELMHLFQQVFEAAIAVEDNPIAPDYMQDAERVREEIVQRLDVEMVDHDDETVEQSKQSLDDFTVWSIPALLERSRKMHTIAARTLGHAVSEYYRAKAQVVDAEILRRLEA